MALKWSQSTFGAAANDRFGIGLKFVAKRMMIINVKMEIVSVNKMDNGIIVNFEDGVCAFFDHDFLYTQTDKRLEADFGDTPSTSRRPGW